MHHIIRLILYLDPVTMTVINQSGSWEIMSWNDDDLIEYVIDSEEFKRAESIIDVRRAVRRKLRKKLIDLHIDDSTSISVREAIVNKHMEWITLRILKEFDGIVILPEYYEDLERSQSVWSNTRLGRSSSLEELIQTIDAVETSWL